MRNIQFRNGMRQEADSLADAMAGVLSQYPHAVFYQQDGSEVEPRTKGRILAWANEDDSYNDDGAKAVASIEAERGQA